MNIKSVILATNEFYHIFNKTVANELVFDNKYHLKRILSLVNFYRFETSISFSKFKSLSKNNQENVIQKLRKTTPLVAIYAFAFMPQHYHLLIKQLKVNGIKNFVSNIQNGMAKFFNIKFKRKGSLFCHSFQRVHVGTEEQFIHLSRYIHLNPVTSYLIKLENLDFYPFTSFPNYLSNKNCSFVDLNCILNSFGNIKGYKKFVYDQKDYQRRLQKIKNLTIEII